MRVLVVAFLLFSSLIVKGQNLLLNGGFEDTLLRTTQLYLPSSWITPSTGSPDLMTNFNTSVSRQVPQNFAGYQLAHSGNNYMGILMYSLFYGSGGNPILREYIQNDINPALQQDSIYCLQLFVSLADSFIHASKNKLGVHFSATRIQSNNSNYLPYTPQIMVSPDSFITEKQAWLEYNFQYKAAGGERYISIGNFTDSSSVDTIFVGGGVRSDPNNLGTYYYLDDIYLGSCDSVLTYTSVGLKEDRLKKSEFVMYPNPAQREVNFNFTVEENDVTELQLLDTLGKLHQTTNLQDGNLHTVSVTELNAGVYIYRLVQGGEVVHTGKLIIH
jgi:hypothetical protein